MTQWTEEGVVTYSWWLCHEPDIASCLQHIHPYINCLSALWNVTFLDDDTTPNSYHSREFIERFSTCPGESRRVHSSNHSKYNPKAQPQDPIPRLKE